MQEANLQDFCVLWIVDAQGPGSLDDIATSVHNAEVDRAFNVRWHWAACGLFGGGVDIWLPGAVWVDDC